MTKDETTKDRSERLFAMSKGELVMHAQDLTLQRDELLKALVNSDKLIEQLMPGIKYIVLQDYGFLNETLLANRAAITSVKGGAA